MFYDDPERRDVMDKKKLPDDTQLFVMECPASDSFGNYTVINLYIATHFGHGLAEEWAMGEFVKPILKRIVRKYREDHDLWPWQRVKSQVIFRSKWDDLDDIVARGQARKIKLKQPA